ARHRTVHAAGEREEARGVLGEEREGRLGLCFLARELRRRDRPAEAGPALAVAGDEDDVTKVHELELRAEDRTEAALFGCAGEPHRAIEAVRSGARECVQSLLDRSVDEVVDIRRAVE